MIKAILAFAVGVLLAAPAFAGDHASGKSINHGEFLVNYGGCHDCHTPGYSEANGAIDPAMALKGNPVGFRGPWGTTYAMNLRILADGMSEDDWVKFLKTFTARPPMPYYNVHALDEVQMRSLHMYIASLGAAGDPAPNYVPPGQDPITPYLVFAPPVMPKQ